MRYGKALKGGPPRRRTVLTTMGWAAEAVAEWVEEIRPLYGSAGRAMWPTERPRAGLARRAVRAVRRTTATRSGWTRNLGPHCLRHSYASHLLEDGFDHLFVQQQLGHCLGFDDRDLHDASAADYKNRALRRALDRAIRRPPRTPP